MRPYDIYQCYECGSGSERGIKEKRYLLKTTGERGEEDIGGKYRTSYLTSKVLSPNDI